MDFIGLPGDLIKKIDDCVKAYNRGHPVLLEGETGVGKSYIAKRIHEYSKWRAGKFVRIDISSIESELFESELFGYEKGAFTGALKEGKKGLLDEGQGGSIFFDEIGNLDLRYQKKFLIFLDERRYRRIGSNRLIELNAGLIFATNIDLKKAIKDRLFREDLYFRISCCVVKIPPLRERIGELERLMEYLTKQKGLEGVRLTRAAMDRLKRYEWPGNIRELLNYLIYWNMAGLELVDVKDLPEHIRDGNMEYNLKKSLNQFKKDFVEKVLRLCGGDTIVASKKMGISRGHLYKLIKQLGIEE